MVTALLASTLCFIFSRHTNLSKKSLLHLCKRENYNTLPQTCINQVIGFALLLFRSFEYGFTYRPILSWLILNT